MKFHQIKIENINSLYGEQHIDLDGRFQDVPLYLILGPTGAGKTTILDAVCLALFGETPRQAGAASAVGALVNSQGTGTSRAEVEFSVLDPRAQRRTRYRAVWAFWRAHNSPDGKPQTPRRELYRQREDGGWNEMVSATTQTQYGEYFKSVLGEMTLEDFLRSVMLAQGEFAALLHAKSDEKAKILERLTDTRVYEQLGALAHERWKEERDHFNRLEEQVERADGVSAEALEQARALLAEGQRELAALEGCRDYIKARHDWLEKSEGLRGQLSGALAACAAVEEKREVHADEFNKLGLDRRARPAQRPLEEVRRIEGETAALGKKMPALKAQVEASSLNFNNMRSAEAQALKKLDAVQAHALALRPKIQAAKEAENNRRHAAEALKSGREKLAAAERAVEASGDQLRLKQEAYHRAEESKKSAAALLADEVEGEQIGEKLPGLRAEYNALEKLFRRLDERHENLGQVEASLVKKRRDLAELEQLVERLEAANAPLERALRDAKNQLEAELGDFDRPRDRRDAIELERQRALSRCAAIESLLELADSRQKDRENVEALRISFREKTAEIERLAECLAPLQRGEKSAQARRAKLQQAVERIRQDLLAAELRQHLHQGDSCPVCGSLEHPGVSAEGELFKSAEEEAAEGELRRLQAELLELEAAAEKNAQEVADIERKSNAAQLKRSQIGARLEVAEESLAALEGRFADQLKAAALPGEFAALSDDAFDSAYEQAFGEVKEEIAAFGVRKERLDAAQDQVEKLEGERKKAGDERQNAQNRLLSEQQALKFALEQRAEARAALDSLRAEAEQSFYGLRDSLSALRVEQPQAFPEFLAGSDGSGEGADYSRGLDGSKLLKMLGNMLAFAGEKHNAWHLAKQALEASERGLGGAQLELEKSRVQHESERAQEARIREELARLEERFGVVERALSACVEALDGRQAAQAEREVEARLKAAREAREQAVEARQQAEKALQQAQGALAHAQSRRAELSEQLKAGQAKLDAAVQEIVSGGADLGSLEQIEAALLAQEERARLQKICDAIELSLRDARRDVARLKEEREAHQARCPAGFEADLYTLGQLAACLEQLSEAFNAQNQRIGRLGSEVEALQSALAELGELIAQRDRQRVERDGWEELNNLIGVKGGARFKEFAQALHLDRIVRRANQRLSQLHPRYQLCTQLDEKSGLPTLAFEIIDHYRAASRRPISTLSGGETFLISLGLALALADQQRIDLPMETLFLDEGFGTLDRASLDNAMKTLKGLHARVGRTVAVISHVEALRDEIAHQVVVEPLVEGRSRVLQQVREDCG